MTERVRMHPEVYKAVKSGDFHSLMKIIAENGEYRFHQKTPKGNNILHVAAQYKQVNFIKDLLQHPSGSSLLWQGNNKGDTPLHVAAKVGSYDAVRVFTDQVKSPDQPDACKDLLRRLNSHNDTSLHYAVRGGHKGVVQLLIEEDPQLCDITNAVDESPLYLAAHRRRSDIIELILSAFSSSSSHKGPKGATAPHAAVYSLPPSWKKIVEKRPELIREKDEMGRTPLHYAAFLGEVKVVQMLLLHDTYAAYDLDKEGQSALHIAAFRGRVNVIDELLGFCPDACDMINIKGQTALHAAVIGRQVNVVKHILEMPNPEDLINEQDAEGNTALHLAAHHKRYNIIYILARDKRVDRLATNKDHLTACDIFRAHKEVGYSAAKVYHVLENSGGFLGFQGWVEERLDKQYVKGQHAVSENTQSNTTIREEYASFAKFQQLASVLIATVTFAASLTMPGGYNNDGMAILAGRAAFQAFVILNSIAFGLSMLALSLQYFATDTSNRLRVGYANTAVLCTYMAEIAMILAFTCSTYVVLPRSIGLGIVSIVGFGCGLIFYHIGIFLDPDLNYFGFSCKSQKRYVLGLLFDYGIL
ncbi:uncharacterized protein LOC130140005 [Syzygium oleosum]|uniref:uncharacterized protein LOC130140005 n=1 Tax=Syzygium oleosum TaxID=219896 RepID=UPI0024B993C0|nr:uncharacterized protein LOC130140005 [Syzygium oleosum]